MCLAIPGLVKNIQDSFAEVDMGGIEVRVSMVLTPDASEGDYVIVHAGFAIAVLDRAEAEETLRILEGFAAAHEE